MTKETIYNSLKDIFRDVFDDEDLNLDESTTYHDIQGWDSLQQINLIFALETKFGIKFSVDEMSELNSVGNMLDLIEKKLTVIS